jgi:hypothetical protein
MECHSQQCWVLERIWAIAKGPVLKGIKVPKGQPAGNIFFHDGFLVSQTATDVTLYPVIADKKKLTVNKKK